MSQAVQPSTPTDDILRQIGTFFRRSQALYQLIKPKDEGLERPAYILLGVIDDLGPLRLSALASAVHLDLSTISRQVAALEHAHMITREPDPADGRACLVRSSELGRTALEYQRDRWRSELTAMLADWHHSERTEFARLFTRLNDAMAARCSMEDE